MRIITALLSALLLSACVSLLPKPGPAPAMFVLEAGGVARAEGGPVNVVVAIAPPQGPRTILGSDLVWRDGDQLAFVADTQWAARADDALQTLVTQTLARQGRVAAAVESGQARADYEVRWNVLNFEIDGASMQARFNANVTLVEALSRRVVASELISAEAPVASRSATVAADALTRAAREGASRIGLFAADSAARAEAVVQRPQQ
ncbi:MAG TPA: ABC-type transport auxiliary lipoprotein family protein [Caulobacterales bacterium]|nr:ABC-type transport auxiliary lipoprotein family protein [Caulobacterales bacterium]